MTAVKLAPAATSYIHLRCRLTEEARPPSEPLIVPNSAAVFKLSKKANPIFSSKIKSDMVGCQRFKHNSHQWPVKTGLYAL